MSSLHFITGAPGAGKTSYSQHLAESMGAFRFSIDEWTETLFVSDPLQKPSVEKQKERLLRCEALVKRIAEQALSLRQTVILDFGFYDLAQRERFYKWAKSNGVSYKVHFIDVPKKVRWERIQKRNDDPTLMAVKIPKEEFDRRESNFDPPSEEELVEHHGVRLALDKGGKK